MQCGIKMELKLQEKIKDIVPDAGMLKDGIDKINKTALRKKWSIEYV